MMHKDNEFNELTQEELEAPIDMNEIRKERVLNLEGSSSAVLYAWTNKGLLKKINKLNTRIVNSGNTLLNITDGVAFFKYSAVVHYGYVPVKRMAHPVYTGVQGISGLVAKQTISPEKM